jgi:hypothetical protein
MQTLSLKAPKLSNVESERAQYASKREKYIQTLVQAARAKSTDGMQQSFRDIHLTNEFLSSLDQLAAEVKTSPVSSSPRFLVSSLFLHESFKKLTADRNEQFFFITGSETEGVHVLDQMLEFTHQKRSYAGVEGDPKSTHALLIKLDQFGHRLLAHFHSHPGDGPGATSPSGTDRDFQQRLEKVGHLTICAIFSRDGYFRVLRNDGNFEFEIFGKGVEKHAEHIYRLTNIN